MSGALPFGAFHLLLIIFSDIIQPVLKTSLPKTLKVVGVDTSQIQIPITSILRT
jgi:hypothetical protein